MSMLWPPSTGPTKMCLMGTLRDNQYLFRTLWASRSPCDTWTLLASCRLWAVAPSLTAARAREPSRQAGAWEDGERDIYIIIYIITMLVLITHCHEVGLVYGILHLAPGTISHLICQKFQRCHFVHIIAWQKEVARHIVDWQYLGIALF